MGTQNIQKLLAVVICTYNGAAHLEEVIRAVLAQDGFEQYVQNVIVVDNKSTDETRAITERIVSESSAVEYQFEEQQGLAFARRHAAKCKCQWVAFLDDDNIVFPGWLDAVISTIEHNSRAGVINGAVIPMPNEAYTSQEKVMLQAFYRDLACTHLTPADSDRNAGIGYPVGAGMCVLTAALKKIDEDGWLKLVGRKGNILLSGEDGEMAFRVKQQGYEFVYSPQIKLYHIIPPFRLTEEYLQRLLSGLVADSYRYISMKPCYVLQRLLRVCKYVGQIMFCKAALPFTQDAVKQVQYHQKIINCRQFIQLAFQDKLTRRDV